MVNHHVNLKVLWSWQKLACEVDVELSDTNQTHEIMFCTELAGVCLLSECDDTSEHPFEQFRVCAVRSSSVDDCSNEHVQWK